MSRRRTAVLLSASVALAIAAASFAAGKARGTPQRPLLMRPPVSAYRFDLVDLNGKVRASLRLSEGSTMGSGRPPQEPELVFFDESGKVVMEIGPAGKARLLGDDSPSPSREERSGDTRS